MLKIYIDGELLDQENAKISVFDHGLLYGDGIFEGIRFYAGNVFQLEAHIDRLYDCARSIHLTIPLDKDAMTAAVIDTIRANDLRDGYVRLLVTRGVGELGLSPYQCEKASVIVIASRIALYDESVSERGVTLVTCGTRRPTQASLSPAVKSLNYLNNVMAKIEVVNAGADEGVMLNEQGYVAECTGDNIFAIKNGHVITPPISSGALDGITRAVVIDILEDSGYTVSEPVMTRNDLYTADEIFITGTAAEVLAAVKYDGRLIGDGKPGPVTVECIEKYHELTKSAGTPIYND